MYLVDHARIQSLYDEIHDELEVNESTETGIKRKCMSTYPPRGLNASHFNVFLVFQVSSMERTLAIVSYFEISLASIRNRPQTKIQ